MMSEIGSAMRLCKSVADIGARFFACKRRRSYSFSGRKIVTISPRSRQFARGTPPPDVSDSIKSFFYNDLSIDPRFGGAHAKYRNDVMMN
jgi:hypothetical protein